LKPDTSGFANEASILFLAGRIQMQVRLAQIADADHAVDVVRRSIQELCLSDHRADAATLSMWLSNKTADNMRR